MIVKNKLLQDNNNNNPPIGVIGAKNFRLIANMLWTLSRYIEKEKNTVPKIIRIRLILNLELKEFLFKDNINNAIEWNIWYLIPVWKEFISSIDRWLFSLCEENVPSIIAINISSIEILINLSSFNLIIFSRKSNTLAF